MVPARALTRLASIPALLALAGAAFPALLLPALAAIAVVVLVAVLDLRAVRNEAPPAVERIVPPRLRRGHLARIIYRVSRPGTGHATVTLLDELPADLGGDVVRENVSLATGEVREVAHEIRPTRRGIRPLGSTYLLWRSPLGLFWQRRETSSGGTVAVFPSPGVPQRRTGLTHRSVFAELGLRPRRPRGEGMEFESLREYVPGDDPRHLDWRATARRGRVMVRQHQVERRHIVVLAVDSSRLMASTVDDCSKLDHALDCAIAVARASEGFGDEIGFVAFDRELRALVRPRRGVQGALRVREAAVALETEPCEPSYRVLVDTLAAHIRKRALVVVFTDFVEGSSSLALERYLRILARRHCVLLVALRDRVLAELDRPPAALPDDTVYRRLALQDLVVERETALSRVRRLGAQTLDLDPADVTAPVLNRYLAIRQAALL